jgi:hypothetical protein
MSGTAARASIALAFARWSSDERFRCVICDVVGVQPLLLPPPLPLPPLPPRQLPRPRPPMVRSHFTDRTSPLHIFVCVLICSFPRACCRRIGSDRLFECCVRRTGKTAPAAAPAEKSARVFVGNLAFKTTNDALKAHMAQASPAIVAAEIISYASGRSKGCGLVEYKSVADAEKAVKTLTNTELEGRKIFVREVCRLRSWPLLPDHSFAGI